MPSPTIKSALGAVALCFAAGGAQGAEPVAADYGEQAVERLSRYVQIDTVNPPGNEVRGAKFLGELLEDAGIPFETAESAPGRGNIWARLKGGRKPGLVLLHHIDVVPANRKFWDFEPLSGDVADGFVYGRGAIDTKGLGMVHLQAFLALKESGARLNRDVWFVATADEEAGGMFGAGWLVEERPELFKKVGYVLNEGGSGRRFGEQTAVMVEVTQKVPLWLRLTAYGRPGHGSAPQVETAVTRLVRATHRIAQTNFKPRLVPPVKTMLEDMVPYRDEDAQGMMANPEAAISDSDFMLSLQMEDPWTHALLRNTCSITRMQGSSKINVVPAEVFAELDCRLLPDQNPDEFLAQLKTIVNDDNIEFTKLMGFSPAVSRADTEVFRAIEAVSENAFGARVVPTVAGGFTDSHFFRDLGIVSYGYSPFVFGPDEFRGVHGNNERVSVQNVRKGTEVMIDLLRRIAVD
jgi:acetylornithine deacetylase/succinyl-diaminopimelate desuccinylase-like protein